MDYRVVILLFLEALFALWLIRRSGCIKTAAQWSVIVTLLLAAFVPRLLALKYETLDYQDFLARWVEFFRSNGGFRALRESVGNYNIPYLYFLALFSYLPIRDLYLIKLLSIFFDVLLAWGVMRLVGRLTDDPLRRIGSFFAVLFLPTVFLNGAVWGQCDSIYVALAVLALADMMDGRPIRAIVLLALSFGFKLQAVFILPVFALFIFTEKLKWRHLPVFPLTYLLLVLPAVIAGRPFADTLLLYFKQTGSVGSGLNYNSPSVFGLFRHLEPTPWMSTTAVFAALLFMAALLLVCLFLRERLDDRLILTAAVLLVVGIPFLLPHMHDRYFFAADILSLALAFGVPLLAPVPALVQFASLLGYYAYLVKRYLLLMDHGARALILAMILLLGYFTVRMKKPAEKVLDNQG